MKFKLYSILSFIFIFIIGFSFFFSDAQEITIHIVGMQNPTTLPLSLWIALCLVLFYCFTLLFFATRSFSNYLNSCSNDKDYKKLIQQIQNQILQNNRDSLRFGSKSYQTLSNVLARLRLIPNLQTPDSTEAQIDNLFEELKQIDEGNTAFPQKIVLTQDTLFWEKDMLNKIKNDSRLALRVLEGNYCETLKENALTLLLQHHSLDEKFIQKLTSLKLGSKCAKTLLFTLIEKGYKLGENEILTLSQEAQLSCENFVSFASLCKAQYAPDFCLALFERLIQSTPKAKLGYLFILLDFSMFDKAQEFIHSEDSSEFALAKAYLDLKESGKNYPLNLFFNIT